jgi:ubiquitin carboxyl-terminal hydrolase 7
MSFRESSCTSSRVEDFWDIQLNVRGNKSIDDSFRDYIQVETLEDLGHHVEVEVVLETFKVKMQNGREALENDALLCADKSESWVYQLHGVLVHSGNLDAGHYYAFLKPTKDGVVCAHSGSSSSAVRALLGVSVVLIQDFLVSSSVSF